MFTSGFKYRYRGMMFALSINVYPCDETTLFLFFHRLLVWEKKSTSPDWSGGV